jgi:hypothetical protein
MIEMPDVSDQRVDFCSPWDNPSVLEYNRYYLRGLSEIAKLTSSTQPWHSAPVSGMDAKVRVSLFVLRTVLMRLGRRYANHPQSFVGHYTLGTGPDRIRFAVDPNDNKRIASQAALDSCDVYFKSNKWSGERYPSKVLPLVNGNGLHDRRSLAFLTSLRNAPKDRDLVFISRLASGVDHNIKVFESLARLKCRKLLIAVLYAQHGHDQYAKTLEGFGVTCVSRNLPSMELWKLMATSRVNFIRLGAKHCVPWRMVDLLCMGSCIAIDRHPLSDWPVPLQDGANFVSCFGRDTLTPPSESDYSIVANTVEHLLDAPELERTIADNNAAYFDRYASPAMVAHYVVQSVLHREGIDAQDALCSADVAPTD